MDDAQLHAKKVSETIDQLVAPVDEISYTREPDCVHCGAERWTVTLNGMSRTEGCDCDEPLAHTWK